MKNIKLIILILVISNVTYSQDIITYHYVLNEYLSLSDSLYPLFGLEQEFDTERKYFRDSSFSETRLFTGDEMKEISYKIENGIWYYKKNKRWKLFYNYHTMVGGRISLFGEKYKIKFNKIVNIRNINIHKITFVPNGVTLSHYLEYYFSPSKGVILIRSSSGIILLRTDSFDNPLTKNEIETL